MEILKKFWEEEAASGTVEAILIIAALVSVALIFSSAIKTYITKVGKNVFGE